MANIKFTDCDNDLTCYFDNEGFLNITIIELRENGDLTSIALDLETAKCLLSHITKELLKAENNG